MMTKKRKWLTLSLTSLLVLIVSAAILLTINTYQPSAKARATVDSAQPSHGYLYFKAKGKSRASIVFYQGALVEEASYAPLANQLAQKGYDVYLLSTPLNLPVLASKQGQELAREKKLQQVYFAGHSLGGVIASSNADSYNQTKGLILLASYPANKTDLSKKPIKVLSITASHDQVLKWKNYEAAKVRLPKDSTYVTIKGGNHSGFGDYGFQKGDGAATISQQDQRQQIVSAISEMIGQN